MLTAFDPLIHENCRTLILGSMPGAISLQKQQYYAHPRNQFWPIMTQLAGRPDLSDYESRCRLLLDHDIGLWDVLHHCERQGSLDQAIREPDPHDFLSFFARYTKIQAVFYNGAAAESLFRRLILPGLSPSQRNGLILARLPSTSPAHTMSYEEKLKQWQIVMLPAGRQRDA